MSSEHEDIHWLREAIRLAWVARERGDFPFGAVLVEAGKLLAASGDESVSRRDPTAHAELLAIRAAGRFDLEAATLYTSCEPCLMCAGALHWARVGRVVFACSQAMLQQQSGGRPKPGLDVLLEQQVGRPAVHGPLLPDEGLAVFADWAFVPKATRVAAPTSQGALVVAHNSLPFRRGFRSRILTRELVPALPGARPCAVWEQELPPGGYIAPHSHPFAEVITFTAGTVELTVDERSETLVAPTTVYVPTGVLHGVENRAMEPARLLAYLASDTPVAHYPNGAPPLVRWDEPS